MGMIRESDAEKIRELFGLLSRDVHLRVFVRQDATDFEKATAGLMGEVGALSERVRFDLIDLNEHEAAAAEAGIERTPAILIESGDQKAIRFFGVPAGGEFGVLIETILDAGTDRPSPLSTDTLKALEQVTQPENVTLQHILQAAQGAS